MKRTQFYLFFILLFSAFTLTVVDVCAATDRKVKVVYFVPRDRPFQWNIPTTLNMQIKAVQRLYAEQMETHGHGRKTFNLENDAGGNLIVYPVAGNFNDAYYHTDTLSKITDEIDDQYDIEKDIYIVIVDVSTERIQGNCGIAYFDGGPVMVAATGDCVQGDHGIDLIAHELGHALNLAHDFRDESYIMSYGATREKLSACAASMLNVSPFFNQDRTAGNTSNIPAQIQMLTSSTYPANTEGHRLRFSVIDRDGLYQVQLLLAVPGEAASMMSCKDFNNTQSAIVEFDMPTGSTIAPINNIWVRIVDQNGHLTTKEWTLTAQKTTNTTKTKTINAGRTETYLTLNYESPDALVPTNNSVEWAGWREKLVWEKTPDGLVPRRPHGFMDPDRSTQFYDEWDYFFYSHAQSRIVYDLGGRNYTKFDAYFDMPNPCGDIASVEVIFLADSIEIYNSGVLKGAQTRNTKISFDIPAGTQALTIRVTDAGDGDGCDHFIFANARLLHGETFVPETINTERTETYLTLNYNSPDALIPINTPTEWGWDWGGWKATWEKKPNEQIPEKPHQGYVSAAHIPYIIHWDHWFYAHAESRIVYDLTGNNYAKFDTYFDMPNPCLHHVQAASMEVIFFADGVEIYNTGVLSGNQARNTHISFNIPAGAQELTIRVTDGGDDITCDHFIFAEARLLHDKAPIVAVENYTDVNNDGSVNVTDLVLVAARYGEKVEGNPNPNPDVNRDGIVDIEDIILVTQNMPSVGGAPAALNAQRFLFTRADLQQAYTTLPDKVVNKGLVVLDLLLGAAVPTETMLLENFPNPFNPETWIPYQLARSADVVIMIFTVDGQVVRRFDLGHQDAGRYANRSRAIYWDGKNAFGEPVASGLYFYTLKAGDFTATRKMLIQK